MTRQKVLVQVAKHLKRELERIYACDEFAPYSKFTTEMNCVKGGHVVEIEYSYVACDN